MCGLLHWLLDGGGIFTTCSPHHQMQCPSYRSDLQWPILYMCYMHSQWNYQVCCTLIFVFREHLHLWQRYAIHRSKGCGEGKMSGTTEGLNPMLHCRVSASHPVTPTTTAILSLPYVLTHAGPYNKLITCRAYHHAARALWVQAQLVTALWLTHS